MSRRMHARIKELIIMGENNIIPPKTRYLRNRFEMIYSIYYEHLGIGCRILFLYLIKKVLKKYHAVNTNKINVYININIIN